MLFLIIELRSLSQSWVLHLSAHHPSEFLLVKILPIKAAAEKAFQSHFSTVLLRCLFKYYILCQSGDIFHLFYCEICLSTLIALNLDWSYYEYIYKWFFSCLFISGLCR